MNRVSRIALLVMIMMVLTIAMPLTSARGDTQARIPVVLTTDCGTEACYSRRGLRTRRTTRSGFSKHSANHCWCPGKMGLLAR